jgi:hypothetical protein
MAGSKRNSVDLINSPIDMGVKAAQDQLDAFQSQFTQGADIPNPVRDYFKSIGVSLKNVKGK